MENTTETKHFFILKVNWISAAATVDRTEFIPVYFFCSLSNEGITIKTTKITPLREKNQFIKYLTANSVNYCTYTVIIHPLHYMCKKFTFIFTRIQYKKNY